MTILNLHLQDFMNIESADLEFNKGINVISGKNGAGKSAVLEAIAFCLIERRRGDSWKDYIRSGATGFKINLVVQKTKNPSDVVEFDYEGNGKFGAVRKKITYQGQTFINSECNDFIRDTFDSEMLENIVFTLQDSKPVTHSTPLERRTIFKKIFNSNFSTTVEKIKSDIEQKEALSESIGYEINAIRSKTYPKMRLESIDPNELTQYLESERALEKQIDAANATMSHRKELDRRTELLQKYILPSYQKIQAELRTLKNNISTSQDTQKFLKDKEASLIREKEESAQKIVQLEESIFSRGEEQKNLASQKEERERVVQAAQEALKVSDVDLSIAVRHLETHQKGHCDTCGQQCDISRIEELERKVASKKDQNITLQKELADLRKNLSALIQAISTLDQHASKDFNDLQVEMFHKSSVEKQIDQITVQKDEATQRELILQRALQEKQGELSLKETEVFEFQDWINANTPSWDKVVDIESLTSQLRDVKSKIVTYNQRMATRLEREALNKRLDEQIEKDNKSIESLATQLNDLSMEIKDLEFVRLFYETTFPNFINTKACTLLEEYMNNFLATTKEGFQFKLVSTKKGIDFMYKAVDKSDWLNVKLASGFETSLANLAFKCAVAFSYGSNLLVLDEPDAYSSEANSERLFETITSINDGFEQIIIITHKTKAMQFLKENGANIYNVSNGVFSKTAD